MNSHRIKLICARNLPSQKFMGKFKGLTHIGVEEIDVILRLKSWVQVVRRRHTLPWSKGPSWKILCFLSLFENRVMKNPLTNNMTLGFLFQ
jgi:hypothetical protein